MSPSSANANTDLALLFDEDFAAQVAAEMDRRSRNLPVLGREEEARRREAEAAGLEADASNGGGGRGGLIDGTGQPNEHSPSPHPSRAEFARRHASHAEQTAALRQEAEARDRSHQEEMARMTEEVERFTEDMARADATASMRHGTWVRRHRAALARRQEQEVRTSSIKRRVTNASTWDLGQILADNDSAGELASHATLEIKCRKAQLRSLGKSAAAAGVARILVNREERQERVVGEEEDGGALRQEVTDLRQSNQALEQRVATLERFLDVGTLERRMAAARELLLGVNGTDEEERQERVVGEEEDVGALRREVTDLRQRVATLERLLGVHGTDEDGSDDDLIDEDVDGVLV